MAMQDSKGRVERIRKVLFDDEQKSPKVKAKKSPVDAQSNSQPDPAEETAETVTEQKKMKSESSWSGQFYSSVIFDRYSYTTKKSAWSSEFNSTEVFDMKMQNVRR